MIKRIACLLKGHDWWDRSWGHQHNLCWRCGAVRIRERISHSEDEAEAAALNEYRVLQSEGAVRVVPHEQVRDMFNMPRKRTRSWPNH